MKYTRLCLLLLLLLPPACDQKNILVNETGTLQPVARTKTIVAGWVSFSSIDLSVYGIMPKNKEKQEHYINRGLFQHSLKKRLRNYTVLFASSPRSAFPRQGDIYIQCTPLYLEKRWNTWKGRSDYLHVQITLTDLHNKKDLYTCSVKLSSMGSFHGNYTDRIAGEMDNATQFLAQLIIHGTLHEGPN